MKNRLRIIITIMLVFVVVSLMIPNVTISVNAYSIPTESEFASKIAELQSRFVDGKYWNKYSSSDYSHTGDTPCTGYGLTSHVACTTRGYCADSNGQGCTCLCGAYVLNGVEKAWQCMGFAYKMGHECFGVSPYAWDKTTSLGTVCAGDIIRINNDFHTIFVYKVDGSTIYYADCNRTGPCRVSWGNTYSYSELSSRFKSKDYKLHLSGNNLSGNGTGGSSSGNLGDGFYATITHMASWNHLTNESNGNVDICWYNYSANQHWKFYRQNDGSYIIKNAATGKCLDVSGTHDGANIQVWEPNGTDPQKWFIIPCGNGYQLQSKYTQSTNCVMEMNAWSFYQGVNCVSGYRDGSDAEIFAIDKKDFNSIGKTDLRVDTSGSDIVFSWNNAWCSTAYNIQIYRGTGTSGSPAISLWNVQNNSFTYHLEKGTYTAYLECFNALGDYVNSTPITFESSGYVDVGTDFYASISHVVSGKYVTAQTNGNVNLSSDTNIANQYWKFFRQSDGSYIIKNAATGKCLDVSGTHDGANIQVWEPNGTDPQKWFIYPCGNGYQLQSKYTQSTNCVMEMNAWSFYEGVNLVSGSKDGSGAEIFAINLKDFNDIGKTNLNVKCKDGKAIFTWGDARCSTAYNIQIWRGNNASGQPTYSLWNVKNNSFTYSLDEGTYTAYIECFNAFSDYVNSTPVTFKVANYNTLSPSASIEYNGHTYEFYNHTYTWYEAYLVCEKLGGHLVTITSPEENNKVVDLVNGACNTVWIGSTKFSSSNWYWVNSEPYTENNFWASGEPNNTSGNEFFIHLYTSGANSGKWNDVIGDTENIKGFICEYDDDIIADNYNPSQVIDHNGYRYELFDYSVDWQTAKRICEKKGGTLADITNAEQQEFIWNFTKQGSKAEYWLGLTDIKDGGVWKWVTGSDSSYNNWKPGTPDYDLGVESYGLIKQDDGTWNDLKGFSYAYHSIGFICKTPLHKIGDTNLDGYITISDVTAIQCHIAELEVFTDEQLAFADTNGDGKVDIDDATHLQKYLAKFDGIVLGKS